MAAFPTNASGTTLEVSAGMLNDLCRCLSVLAVVPPVLSVGVAVAAPGPSLDVWTRTAMGRTGSPAS